MHCHMEAHLLEGMAVIVQEYPDNQQWSPPYGINNIGDFLWPKKPTNWWKVGCIIAIVAILLIITVALGCICYILRKKKKGFDVDMDPSGNVQNNTQHEESPLLEDSKRKK